ncbi:hypothetical protein JZU51_00300, partial [bacterium]|nr:hypothetical protein [bacterium]
GIVKLKSRSLEEVNTELELAVKNQKEVNVNDKASVEAVNKKVWALTAEKEAYEKLFTMRKDRGKNLDPMEERLNSIPLVTEKTPTPIAGIRIKPNKTYQVDALVEYGKQMDVITKKSLLYSDALETVIERKQATQAAIDALLSEGWAAESLDVQKLMTQLDLYNKQQTQITGISETTKDALNQLGNSFQQLGSSIGGAAGSWFTFAATLL